MPIVNRKQLFDSHKKKYNSTWSSESKPLKWIITFKIHLPGVSVFFCRRRPRCRRCNVNYRPFFDIYLLVEYYTSHAWFIELFFSLSVAFDIVSVIFLLLFGWPVRLVRWLIGWSICSMNVHSFRRPPVQIL